MAESIDLTKEDPKAFKVVAEPKQPQTIDLSKEDANSFNLVSVPHDRFNPAESAALGATQGATLGYGDEIAGAFLAAKDKLTGKEGSYKDLYQQHRDEQRDILKQAEQENPKAYIGGSVAGAAAPMVIPGVGPAATAGRLSLSALRSAALGALSAGGLTETSPTDTGQFAKDIGKGAALGGALELGGAAIANAAKSFNPTEAVQNVADKVKNADFSKTLGEFGYSTNVPFGKQAGQLVGVIADKFGPGVAEAAANTAKKIETFAQQSPSVDAIKTLFGKTIDAAKSGDPSAIATFEILDKSNPKLSQQLKPSSTAMERRIQGGTP